MDIIEFLPGNLHGIHFNSASILLDMGAQPGPVPASFLFDHRQ